ncbi:sigma-70 family RNA polymerase sigma factor [Roseomonas hellenica]|nr:sigma-70 family RNA polymerase sigma factor [Plastoroseomonas hellenica]
MRRRKTPGRALPLWNRSPLPNDSKLELYFAHRPALVEYAAALLGDRGHAEDLVQEAFLRFVPDGRSGDAAILNPAAYLYRIVRNLAWDQLRRYGGERRREQEPAFWMRPATPRTPEEDAIHRQTVARVAGILAGLPEKARIALEMQRFGGHTLAEIAARLGVSVPTAHRLARDALLRVAIALDQDEGQP